MANRQTKRERKFEAKQRRLAEQRRAERRRKLRKVKALVTILVIGGLVYGAFWLSGLAERRRIAGVNKLAAAAGCDELDKPTYKGRDHVSTPQPTGAYSSDPPTSGPHYDNRAQPPGPAPTGVHTQPLQTEVFIHNLEHGHIGIFYKPTLAADIREGLEQLVSDNDEWMVMSQRDSMPATLALGAWTRLVECQSPANADAVLALAGEFRRQFQGKGFETFPGTPIVPR